jgi:hypothetical protein
MLAFFLKFSPFIIDRIAFLFSYYNYGFGLSYALSHARILVEKFEGFHESHFAIFKFSKANSIRNITKSIGLTLIAIAFLLFGMVRWATFRIFAY